MSIHKSKGLEFQSFFLANSNKQFNKQDIRNDDVLLHPKYGLGIKYIDYNLQLRYETIARQMVKRKIEIENLSEEMRILYVALTRAKEKNLYNSNRKRYTKKLDALEKMLIYIKKKKENKIRNPKKCNSYLDWILQTYLYNKEKTEKIAEINLIQKDDIKEIWKDSNDDSNQTSLEEILKEELKDYNSDKNIR